MPSRCHGVSEQEPCVFGKGGGPARAKPGTRRCTWCDTQALPQVVATPGGRSRLRQLFRAFSETVATKAFSRLPQEARQFFTKESLPALREDGPKASRKRPAASPSSEARPHRRPAAAALGIVASVAQLVVQPVMRRRRRKSPPVPGEAPAPPPAPEPAPPAPAAPDRTWQVNFTDVPNLEEAEAVLEAHAAAVAPLLQKHWIPGDGNCLYRSAALQTPHGQDNHLQLRQQSVAKTLEEWYLYSDFFAGDDCEAEVASWARRMSQDRFWGDGIACRSLTCFLNRPVIIWRPAAPHQKPSCFVPPDFATQGWTKPIYLELNEEVAGSEHYSALVPKPPPVPVPAASPKTNRSDKPSKTTTPAEKRGLHGLEALGVWGTLGLTRDEYKMLLELLEERTPSEATNRLQTAISDLHLTGISETLLKNLKQAQRRKAAKNKFEKQLRVIQLVQEGKANTRAALQTEVPGLGVVFLSAVLAQHQSTAEHLWKQEFLNTFSVTNRATHGGEWDQDSPAGTSWTAKAQEWMKVASWLFCPDCGRRELTTHVAWQWRKNPQSCVKRSCPHECDLHPLELQKPTEQPLKSSNLKAYVTPQANQWHQWIQHIAPGADEQALLHQVLSREESHALALVDFHVDFTTRRGGQAPVTSKQKRSIVRASWKATPPEAQLRSEAGQRAFDWLVANNPTYEAMVKKHAEVLRQRTDEHGPLWIPTAELLLRLPGLEVAARPWLYPYAACGDTDVASRLKQIGRIAASSTPSLKTSAQRKLLSRCTDFASDYGLQCFLYDVSLARAISTVVNLADQKKMAPETFASDMAAFEMYWHREGQKLEDVCRQAKRLPELFFTLAPAEWKFPLHEGALPPCQGEELTQHQMVLTLHMYNSLQALLRRLVFEEGDALASCGIEEIEHWCLRFEFQKRGTIHVHVLCWLKTAPGVHPEQLSGQTGSKHSSALVNLLESIFRCSVDVQGGKCGNALLKYVTGYVTKASDALQFRSKDRKGPGNQEENSKRRQIYRLLCKRSPLEQEMTMDMAGMSMVKASFTGACLHAPILGSVAINHDRHLYNAFQQWLTKPEVPGDSSSDPAPADTNFLEWCRLFDIRAKKPLEKLDDHGRQAFQYELRRRNVAGRGRGKACAVAMQFPFELLDIFIGSWAATFGKNLKEEEIWPKPAEEVPENMVHLAAILKPERFGPEDEEAWASRVDALSANAEADLHIRGLGKSRVSTFAHRIRACGMVLREVALKRADPSLWSANQLFRAPRRHWSPEQQLVLDAIERGTNITDANALADADRILQVTGGPGTGKTEVVIAAALAASERGCRVLIGAPIGLLVAMYRQDCINNRRIKQPIHNRSQVKQVGDRFRVKKWLISK